MSHIIDIFIEFHRKLPCCIKNIFNSIFTRELFYFLNIHSAPWTIGCFSSTVLIISYSIYNFCCHPKSFVLLIRLNSSFYLSRKQYSVVANRSTRCRLRISKRQCVCLTVDCALTDLDWNWKSFYIYLCPSVNLGLILSLITWQGVPQLSSIYEYKKLIKNQWIQLLLIFSQFKMYRQTKFLVQL